MKDSKNISSKDIAAKSKSAKTPQWIRDVAAGVKNNSNPMSGNNIPTLASTDQYDNKKRIRMKKYNHQQSKSDFISSNKIKKARQKLLEIEESKRNDKNNEIIAEKKVENEENRIDDLMKNRLQN